MNAQFAVEAGRFQTEHLVSSFDNHAMSPGTLLVDERTAQAVITELQRRKHIVDIRTRYASGAAARFHTMALHDLNDLTALLDAVGSSA